MVHMKRKDVFTKKKNFQIFSLLCFPIIRRNQIFLSLYIPFEHRKI